MAIALSSSTCPVSKRQMPWLAKLEQELSNRGIALLVLNPMKTETDDEIRAQVTAAGVRSTVCHDATQAVARALQARTTTEVFLLAPDRTLVYRGALDDQYGVTFSREAPTVSHLLEAADALKAGRKPLRAMTSAPGCELDLGPRPAAAPTTTPAWPGMNLEWPKLLPFGQSADAPPAGVGGGTVDPFKRARGGDQPAP